MVRSELQKLHHLEEHHEKIIKGLKARLGETATGIDKLSNEFMKLNYTTMLEHMTLELAEGLNNYQQSVRRLIGVIHAAGDGRLHPALITNKQLTPIAREAQDHLKDSEFPLALSKVNRADLVRISAVAVRMQNKKLLLALDIPLLERSKYQLYKLHQLPVSQTLLGNGTGRAYVAPRAPSNMSFNSWLSYMSPDSSDLRRVTSTEL